MKKEKTFEKAFERLEQIVDEFESGDVNLDDMLKKYEESAELIQYCLKKLEAAEKKIKLLNNGQITESNNLNIEE